MKDFIGEDGKLDLAGLLGSFLPGVLDQLFIWLDGTYLEPLFNIIAQAFEKMIEALKSLGNNS